MLQLLSKADEIIRLSQNETLYFFLMRLDVSYVSSRREKTLLNYKMPLFTFSSISSSDNLYFLKSTQ